MQIGPLAGALGAEIHGVDLRHLSSWGEVKKAFLAFSVLVFRDQKLEPADLMRVGARFGEPCHYPFVTGMDGFPFIFEVVKEPEERRNFGGAWHSDTTYLKQPPLATLLYAVETPDYGGDTLFANASAAYDALSEGMRKLMDGLIGVNSAELKYAGGRTVQHAKIKGMTQEESAPLLNYLVQHQTKPEFTCRVRWAPGTLTVWDNRCTQHNAVNDYHGQRRRMRRLTVGPQTPH